MNTIFSIFVIIVVIGTIIGCIINHNKPEVVVPRKIVKTQKKNILVEKKVEKKAAAIQLMVTKDMRRQLTDLGYNKFQIDDLTPAQASHAIINNMGPK